MMDTIKLWRLQGETGENRLTSTKPLEIYIYIINFFFIKRTKKKPLTR